MDLEKSQRNFVDICKGSKKVVRCAGEVTDRLDRHNNICLQMVKSIEKCLEILNEKCMRILSLSCLTLLLSARKIYSCSTKIFAF